MRKPEDEPIEVQMYAIQEIRKAITPFVLPGGNKALEEVWLTRVLPGRARNAAFDDGDWALVWAKFTTSVASTSP